LKQMANGNYFIYHAQASAFGGTFRRPWVEAVDSQAATALPVTGGKASTTVKGFNFKGVDRITFDSATTELSGDLDTATGNHITSVKTTVLGLNIDNVLKAESVVAKIVTTHVPGDIETWVDPTGSEIKGLEINGEAIPVDLDLKTFADLNTCAKFKDKFKSDRTFKDQMRKRFLWDPLPNNAPDFLKTRYKWQADPNAQPESQGIMPCSLVKSVTSTNLQVWGNVIIVPNFGTVYLGEYLVKDGARRITMMRLMLGSPMEGDLTVASGEGNGVTFP
jgi:hypothetical protein